jgi:hypothetical protein
MLLLLLLLSFSLLRGVVENQLDEHHLVDLSRRPYIRAMEHLDRVIDNLTSRVGA